MTRSREYVLELYRAYTAGESVASIAERIDGSRALVYALFAREQLPALSTRERTHERYTQLAEEARPQIHALYREHGRVATVMNHVENIPRAYVAKIIAEMPNREAYRRRGRLSSYSRETLIDALQRAAEAKGEPLTIPAYREATRGLGLPAFDSVYRHFYLESPDDPWQAALRAAGVQGNPPRVKRGLTFADRVAAVKACIQAHGGERVSYAVYQRWPDRPISGQAVRMVEGWNIVVECALDELAEGVP